MPSKSAIAAKKQRALQELQVLGVQKTCPEFSVASIVHAYGNKLVVEARLPICPDPADDSAMLWLSGNVQKAVWLMNLDGPSNHLQHNNFTFQNIVNVHQGEMLRYKGVLVEGTDTPALECTIYAVRDGKRAIVAYATSSLIPVTPSAPPPPPKSTSSSDRKRAASFAPQPAPPRDPKTRNIASYIQPAKETKANVARHIGPAEDVQLYMMCNVSAFNPGEAGALMKRAEELGVKIKNVTYTEMFLNKKPNFIYYFDPESLEDQIKIERSLFKEKDWQKWFEPESLLARRLFLGAALTSKQLVRHMIVACKGRGDNGKKRLERINDLNELKDGMKEPSFVDVEEKMNNVGRSIVKSIKKKIQKADGN